ncbi:MAG: polymer-forming cytoskeletal protein [Emergencia sp.]|nr:polymer-forming cytoskeletal protein [Emergencia sp.]
MSPISNFTQAMKELTGFDDDSAKEKVRTAEKREEFARDREYREREPFQMPQMEPRIRPQMEIAVPAFNQEAGTVISGSMVITGNIESSDQIKADGCIFGDLNTTSSVIVNGKIIGDVATDSLEVSGSIKGAVKVSTDARIEHAAVIMGDIKSANLQTKGKVKGNLEIKNVADITASAVVVGNIDTGELNSERGCVINGNVTTRNTRSFTFDEEQLFSIGE